MTVECGRPHAALLVVSDALLEQRKDQIRLRYSQVLRDFIHDSAQRADAKGWMRRNRNVVFAIPMCRQPDVTAYPPRHRVAVRSEKLW